VGPCCVDPIYGDASATAAPVPAAILPIPAYGSYSLDGAARVASRKRRPFDRLSKGWGPLYNDPFSRGKQGSATDFIEARSKRICIAAERYCGAVYRRESARFSPNITNTPPVKAWRVALGLEQAAIAFQRRMQRPGRKMRAKGMGKAKLSCELGTVCARSQYPERYVGPGAGIAAYSTGVNRPTGA
jgi:hypothetical protein